jgi:flagellar biosynthesis protein FlhB
MAEGEDSSQDKTEEATTRKLEKAREEGQLPRSKELNTMAVLVAGTAGLLMFGSSIGKMMADTMRFSFTLPREVIFDTKQMVIYMGVATVNAALSIWPLLAVLLVAAIVGPISLGGFLFSTKALMPKFSRINPIAGLKRMFSMNSIIELLKAIAKVAVVGTTAYFILQAWTPDLLQIGHEPIERAMAHSATTVGWSFLMLSLTMILIAAVDIPYQTYSHAKKMRMTKQEVKDEYKDTEGKPEVKGRIRRLQMEMAQRRMMQDIPTADVVITNPTHYAVALKYDGKSMSAPIVVAKGSDHLAFKIREVAAANKVEILSSPPLARAVYHSTDIGSQIPSGLYMAVAQVLAYVFQLRQFRKGRGQKPGKLSDFRIPDDLRRDE